MIIYLAFLKSHYILTANTLKRKDCYREYITCFKDK